jgi:hypothetical protein
MSEIGKIDRRTIRLAAAHADCNEATALRVVAGFKTRGDTREPGAQRTTGHGC